MSVIRTVEELSRDPKFAGYYDLEEKHRQDLMDEKLTGIRIGKEEKAISTAKKMLKDNLDDKMIAKYTDLSLEEIEKLKEEK